MNAWVHRLMPSLLAILVALLVASCLILWLGQGPLHIYALLLAGTVGNGYGFGQLLYKTTPLIFTGLAVAVGLRAGLFNIGAEGQLSVGGLACAWVGNHLPAGCPALLAIALCTGAGFVAGALFGAIAGWLKAWRGAHEVVTTIMLNFVARAALLGVGKQLFVTETMHTQAIISHAELPRLSRYFPSLHGAAVNAALLVALASALAVSWFLYRTIWGLRLRALGDSRLAAQAVGISTARMTLLAMALSGGLAGLVSTNFVLGYKHYYEDGFSGGIGFIGIAVAVLGQNQPFGVVLAAFLLGLLSQGALAINTVVPKELVDVLQAVIILSVVAVVPTVQAVLRHAPVRGER